MTKNGETHRESYYQAKILEWLRRTYPKAFIWKAQQGPYSNRNGIPDICAVIDGKFFAFEVKRPGGKPTKLQELAIALINKAGGIAAVVSTPDQAREIIERATAQSQRA